MCNSLKFTQPEKGRDGDLNPATLSLESLVLAVDHLVPPLYPKSVSVHLVSDIGAEMEGNCQSTKLDQEFSVFEASPPLL